MGQLRLSLNFIHGACSCRPSRLLSCVPAYASPAAGWLSVTPALARSTPSPAVANTYRFDIGSSPLASALATFELVTGSTVALPNGASLDGLQSPGVVGVFTADQAIARLLGGTGLCARLTGVNAYRLEVQVAGEDIEVTATGPYETTASDTATRTYTPLRDVPQAITVVTRTMIAEQSMQSLADVVRYVPGVGMAQGEGNRDAAVFRGNNSTADFFVDGVRDDVQYFRDLYNVERVEALKGPNAMIFGRGGAGGVLNRTTASGQLDRRVRKRRCRRVHSTTGASCSMSATGWATRCRARDGDVRELR